MKREAAMPRRRRSLDCVVAGLLVAMAGWAWSAEWMTLRTRSGIVWTGEVVRTDERGALVRTPERVEVLLLWTELSDESRVRIARAAGIPPPVEVATAGSGAGTAGPKPSGTQAGAGSAGPRVAGTAQTQLYDQRVAQDPPRTAEGHRSLARASEEWGIPQAAEHHHRVADALAMKGIPAATALGVAQGLRGAGGAGLAPEYCTVIEQRLLEHDWEGALGLLRARIPATPDGPVADELRGLAEHLDAPENVPSHQDRLVFAIHLALDAKVRAVAARIEIGYPTALAELTGDVVGSVAEEQGKKMAMSREEAVRRFERRSGPFVRMIGYGGATWLVEAPALGSPEDWWEEASSQERMAFLCGQLAEKDLRVLAIRHKGCSRCGGSGTLSGTADGSASAASSGTEPSGVSEQTDSAGGAAASGGAEESGASTPVVAGETGASGGDPKSATEPEMSAPEAGAPAGRIRCPRCIGLGIERVVVYQ